MSIGFVVLAFIGALWVTDKLDSFIGELIEWHRLFRRASTVQKWERRLND